MRPLTIVLMWITTMNSIMCPTHTLNHQNQEANGHLKSIKFQYLL